MQGGVERKVPCPTCRRPAVFGRGNPWRPFCGERCRSADLGAWASASYRLPVQGEEEDPGGPSQSPAGV